VTTLSITLFGSFQATLEGRPITRFESNKVRALLAYLAVEADRPHSRDELIGLLWPDQTEATARANLRQALANLRLALGERDAAAAYIRITPDGIQFQSADHPPLDVYAFSRLWAECKAHPHRRLETCRSCTQRLRQAIDLYRGDFLAHFLHSASAAFEEWVLARREHWRQGALDALYYLAQHHLLRSDYDQALCAARRQLSLDAWREEAHRQVMQALALSGQRCAALAQFAACRRLLKQELDVEPACETISLLEQIKSGQLGPNRPRQPALPVAATPLLGRARELAEIDRLLENPACRLLTLTGPGGIGKTRLARQVVIEQAGAFADHIHFVQLAPLSSAEFIVPAIAAALGLTLTGPDEPQTQLLRHLRALETVVVLDNFEHLLKDGVSLIVEIMQHAPRVVLLVTSRERLNLAGEWALEVHGLDFPYSEATAQTESYAALELFMHSARRIRPEFSLAVEDQAAVQRICQLVDGLPLAIELAATWLNVLSCQQVARQLSENLALLNAARHGPTDQPASLHSVFEKSWQLLTVEERRVFQNLAVFRGGALPEAALAVAGAELAALANLIDKSFIRRQGERYRVHELLRHYAAEKLAAAGETDEVRTRHAQFHLKLAEAVNAQLGGPDQATWLDRLEAEKDNFRAALDWSLAHACTEETALRLVVALSQFWQVRGYVSEAREWCSRALAQMANAPLTPLRVKVLDRMAYLAHLQSDYSVANQYHTICLAARQEFGDERAIAESWRGLGITHHAQGDYAVARICYEASLTLCRKVGDKSGMATSLSVVSHNFE
jgi:predicted ATPase